MNQITADMSIYASEQECGETDCWVWAALACGTDHVYSLGQRYTVRRYIYEVYRGQGYELGGPLAPRERLVNTCGNSACVSPHHHVPAEEARARRKRGEPLLSRKPTASSPRRDLSEEERWEHAQRANFAPKTVPPWY